MKKQHEKPIEKKIPVRDSSEISDLIKKIQQEDKKVKEEKKAKAKEETTEQKSEKKESKISYKKSSEAYGDKTPSLDYEKLFDYFGRGYKEYKEGYASEETHKKEDKSDHLTEEQLEKIIKQEQGNIMLGASLNKLDIDEKEKYKKWKTFNTFWNIVKIQLAGVGEGATGVFYV